MLLTEDGLLVDLGLVDTAGFIGHGHMALQTGGGVLGAHAPVGDEQLANLLIQGHLLDISGGALSGGQTPVVDGGDNAGAVDILEVQTVLLNDGTLHGGDGGTVGVLINLEVFRCFDCHEITSTIFSFTGSGDMPIRKNFTTISFG